MRSYNFIKKIIIIFFLRKVLENIQNLGDCDTLTLAGGFYSKLTECLGCSSLVKVMATDSSLEQR